MTHSLIHDWTTEGFSALSRVPRTFSDVKALKHPFIRRIITYIRHCVKAQLSRRLGEITPLSQDLHTSSLDVWQDSPPISRILPPLYPKSVRVSVLKRIWSMVFFLTAPLTAPGGSQIFGGSQIWLPPGAVRFLGAAKSDCPHMKQNDPNS